MVLVPVGARECTEEEGNGKVDALFAIYDIIGPLSERAVTTVRRTHSFCFFLYLADINIYGGENNPRHRYGIDTDDFYGFLFNKKVPRKRERGGER